MNENLKNYGKTLFLPLCLAILFVVQNEIFNVWIGIYSPIYFWRLTSVALGLGVILFGPALFFNKKIWRYVYLFLVSFVVSFLFSAQFLYYKFSESFLQFSALKYLGEAGSVSGTIKTLLTPGLLLFCAGFLLVLVFCIFSFKKKIPDFKISFYGKIAVLAGIIIIGFLGYRYLLYAEEKQWGNANRLYADVYDLNSLIAKMGIIDFSIEDTYKYLLHSNLVTVDDKKFLKEFAQNKAAPPSPGKDFGLAKGKNLIIIQVESLENSVINTKINGQEITPNLNQLAKDGLYFDNYYTQVGPGNTADAEFSTLDSLYPLANDVVFISYAKNYYNALPHLLAQNGYKTYSFHGDVPTFWNRSNIYPGLGYQTDFDLGDFKVTRPVGQGPSDLGDEDLFSQSLPRLEKLKNPFMATLITMSSHTPFILPADLQTLQIPADDARFDQNQKNYLESVHYTDKAIGEFIDGLKKSGLYDDSLIFIWGDHGSFTNITKALGKDKDILPGLENSQVPMILLNSGLSGTDSAPGSHLDIYPTAADLLGIAPPKTILGQDLLETKTSVVLHFNLVSGGINAILSSDLAYEANQDGEFTDGTCLALPEKSSLPISSCQELYNSQSSNLRASDIIVRGNLLGTFAKYLK